MHIFFSAIGGTAIGPLALIAKQAGYQVSGSDKQDSDYIRYLKKQGITDIHIGQTQEQISQDHTKNPIDWFVYSSAVAIENPNSPEFQFVKEKRIKSTKRDELLNHIIQEKNLKLIAIAGTHGKTTTTSMVIWALKQLGIPVSYSVGAKIRFGEMGEFSPDAKYFVYEADEFDRNFLSFKPYISIISGIDYDHPDIYPTRNEYYQAFVQFINQSASTFIWQEDATKLNVNSSKGLFVLNKKDCADIAQKLPGKVNREDAQIVASALSYLEDFHNVNQLSDVLNKFPGVSRRFEKISQNIYSDYAHTPEKIRGAIQIAQELAGNNFVVVYEGLHNTRQHFIKQELKHLFDDVKMVYIVPSYLAREDKSLELLTPQKIAKLLANPDKAIPSELNDSLKNSISQHVNNGDLVLCLSAGGGGSLDEWLRQEY